jgi:tetratricopeptide (TPR) repeat protein
MNPSRPARDPRLDEAMTRFSSGDLDSAKALFEAVLASSAGHPLALAHLGLIALSGGDAATAVLHLGRSIEAAPLSPALYVNRSTALTRLGRIGEAAADLRKALVLDPTNVKTSAVLAERFVALNETAAAERWFTRVATLDKREPTLWYNLGVTRVALGDLRGASEAYRRHGRLLHGRPLTDSGADPDPELPVEPVRPAPRLTCWHRLTHDRAQLVHLRERGTLPSHLHDEPDRYAAVLDSLSAAERSAETFELDDARYERIARTYGRFVHIAHTNWDDRPALSDAVNWAEREDAFLSGDPRAVTIDGMLTAEALTALRRFIWDSTIWHQIKAAGYLGAYLREGFGDPLVVRIAEELRHRMPRVLGGLNAKVIWAYSYEQTMAGINPHADFAKVNLNFWITPDAANLDPETGGLIVYRKAAPPDWDFSTYNTASADFIYGYLGQDRDDFLRIPHRANRAAMFDSRLIHETDRFSFAPGHTSRRINITVLFGEGG